MFVQQVLERRNIIKVGRDRCVDTACGFVRDLIDEHDVICSGKLFRGGRSRADAPPLTSRIRRAGRGIIAKMSHRMRSWYVVTGAMIALRYQSILKEFSKALD